MPECRKCHSTFPNWLKIEGVLRNLSSRKFCTVCSPYGAGNTHSDLDDLSPDRVCERCHKAFQYVRNSGNTRSLCTTCQVTHRRPIAKRFAIEYKGGSCLVCGYDKCDRAMDFHHLDPEEKDSGITALYLAPKVKLIAELNKCVLVCTRCHMEIEAGMITPEVVVELENTRKAQMAEHTTDNREAVGSTPTPSTN